MDISHLTFVPIPSRGECVRATMFKVCGLRADSVTETDQIDFQVPSALVGLVIYVANIIEYHSTQTYHCGGNLDTGNGMHTHTHTGIGTNSSFAGGGWFCVAHPVFPLTHNREASAPTSTLHAHLLAPRFFSSLQAPHAPSISTLRAPHTLSFSSL